MISIRHYDAIGNTPAMAIVVRCWLDLLERDLCDPGGFPVAWDNKGFVAFQDERPVGVMTYSDTAWLNALTIHIAYVEPGSRRQGVHTMMWAEAVKKARELKRPVISGGTSLQNGPMRAVMKAQGRIETMVLTRYELPEIIG